MTLKRHAVQGDLGGYNDLLVGRNTTTGNSRLDASTQPIREAMVQARPSNANVVRVGNDTAILWELSPGESVTIPINSLAKIWVAIGAGDGVNWIAV